MKIRVIACCLNEEEMLPHFLDYYGHYVDEIVIYDGGSTDYSHEIIRAFPKAKLIIDKHEKMDERKLTGIRNEAYKADRYKWDWQIVVDVDEFLYHPMFRATLADYKLNFVSLPKIVGYDMYSKEFPPFVADKNIFDFVKKGRRNDQWQNKRVVFDPRSVDINYGLGCHTCSPTGYVKESDNADLKLLHFNYVGYQHFIKRHRFNAERMSVFNKEHNLAYHIPMFAKMTEDEFNKKVDDEAKDIILY
ncbi:MAG: glycosyltransferase family 2 protein [Nitrospirae bacterium]|nr:glycosyltransferase family 2 protein [Nitrospirota bacterium]